MRKCIQCRAEYIQQINKSAYCTTCAAEIRKKREEFLLSGETIVREKDDVVITFKYRENYPSNLFTLYHNGKKDFTVRKLKDGTALHIKTADEMLVAFNVGR